MDLVKKVVRELLHAKSAMTVRDLIEKLSQLDPDMPVARATGKHDDWYEEAFSVRVEPLAEDGILLREGDLAFTLRVREGEIELEPEDDAETTLTCVIS